MNVPGPSEPCSALTNVGAAFDRSNQLVHEVAKQAVGRINANDTTATKEESPVRATRG